MGLSRLHGIIAVFVLIAALIYGWNSFLTAERSSCYTIDVKYFGRDSSPSSDKLDDSIKRFKIPFDQSQINDMLDRVRKTRFYETEMLIDNQQTNRTTYGFNRQTAESVRKYLLEKFDWKKTVDNLNEFDNYQTNIVGLNIHFVRITKNISTDKTKQAILFLHGWPGSYLEYLDVARLLNSSTNRIYDLIIPSLPGYGYSDAAVRSGLNPSQMARIMHILMQRLQYHSYVVCGGDWGAIIGTFMAQLYSNHVQGLLITMPTPNLIWKHYLQIIAGHYLSPSFLLDFDEQEYLGKRFTVMDYFKTMGSEFGYFHLQATKPDTVGYALNDSPMGLATYILEKWSRWSNSIDDIDHSLNSGLDRFTLDQLLSNVILYWTTGTITSSMRIYFEYVSTMKSGHENKLIQGSLPTSLPVAIANYRQELFYFPRTLVRSKYPNITLWTFHRDGGHFAAMEKPQQYHNDIEQFLDKL